MKYWSYHSVWWHIYCLLRIKNFFNTCQLPLLSNEKLGAVQSNVVHIYPCMRWEKSLAYFNLCNRKTMSISQPYTTSLFSTTFSAFQKCEDVKICNLCWLRSTLSLKHTLLQRERCTCSNQGKERKKKKKKVHKNSPISWLNHCKDDLVKLATGGGLTDNKLWSVSNQLCVVV